MADSERRPMDDALLERIYKLLQMTEANGCTPNEAAVAAGKAAKLLEEYGVEMSTVQMKAGAKAKDKSRVREDRSEVTEVPANRSYEWAINVMWSVGEVTFTKFFYQRGRGGYLAVVWIGEHVDVEAAKMLYKWLMEQAWVMAKTAWRARPKTVRCPNCKWQDDPVFPVQGGCGQCNYTQRVPNKSSYLPWETSFLKGYADGLWHAANQVKKDRKASESGTGLVAWKDGAIEEYLRETRPWMFPDKNPKPVDETPAKKTKKAPKYRPRKEKPPAVYQHGRIQRRGEGRQRHAAIHTGEVGIMRHRTASKTETTYELEVDRGDILKAMRASTDIAIPDDAKVYFQVPGGGDWCNTPIDIDPENPVIVKFTVETKVP